ncbi:hypothetical protein LSTR_LSTR014459 [Laodelphax striatellus]|uniref:C2H2-type domain-containing protein n=1 Tax=Laodelphax striatellus TaxID=195883 RepID=A0A482XBZ5_LAOST|nr:hypothetical protein LSTR_LSTR014459 [Laodelphax striatellus]
MDHDQSDLDNCMQESENVFEFVEVKMEPYEELDVKQMKPEPACDAASKMWNEVGSSYQTCIKDELIKKEEEQQQDEPKPLSTDWPTFEHSVADDDDDDEEEESENSDEPNPLSTDTLNPFEHSVGDDDGEEQCGNSVNSSGLGQTLNRPEIEQPTSSPLFSCTRCDYKCARFSVLSKHIRTTHVAAKSNECGGANQKYPKKQ